MSEDLVARIKFLEDIIQSLPGGVFQFHAGDDGSMYFSYQSQRAYELAHLPPDWQLGINACPEDRDRLIESVHESVRTVSPWEFEGRCITASEEVLWIKGIALSARKKDGVVFNGLLLDITERKRAEGLLRESEERYRQLVETCQEGVWLIDADLRTTYVNQRMTDMLGYTRDEMLGRSPLDFVDDSYIEKARAGLEIRKLGGPGKAELRYRRKDGTELWAIISTSSLMDDSGKFIGALGMITDITDHKRAEEALYENKNRLEAALEIAQMGSYQYSDDFLVVVFDERARYILGLEGVENPRQVWGERIYAEDRSWLSELTRSVEEGTQDRAAAEYRYNHPEHGVIWLRHSVRVLARDSDGKMTSQAGVVQDITERKRAEEALRELEAHKRDFYRKTILAATKGKLDVVEPEDIRALGGELVRFWRFSTPEEYASTLHQSFALAESLGFKADSLHNFMSCAGEMLSNAQKHAGGGEASLYRTDNRILFVVSDTGSGIDSINLPDVALVYGYSTAGTGGMGYKLIIGSADKTYLTTGPDGTTVAVEMRMPG